MHGNMSKRSSYFDHLKIKSTSYSTSLKNNFAMLKSMFNTLVAQRKRPNKFSDGEIHFKLVKIIFDGIKI